MAVAVTARLETASGGRKRDHARLVVWGSVLSISDNNLKSRGMESSAEVGYVLNNFRWLLGEEASISIPGRHSGRKPPDMNVKSVARIWWLSVLGFPSLGLILGILAWFLRRK